MKIRPILPPLLLIIQLVFFNSTYAHTINSSLGHSYSTIYTVLYFIGKVLPFAGLGILTQFPSRKMGYDRLVWTFVAVLCVAIVPGYYFHDYFSIAYFNYFLTMVIGILIIFYSGNHTTTLKSLIIFSSLPLGYDLGLQFGHADAWLVYLITIFAVSIVVFIGISKLSSTLSERFRWVKQSVGIILVIAGMLSILLF